MAFKRNKKPHNQSPPKTDTLYLFLEIIDCEASQKEINRFRRSVINNPSTGQ